MACENCGKQLTTYELYAIEETIKAIGQEIPHMCSSCQPIFNEDAIEKRLDVIGQNGALGLHYEH
jgi:hypothetical protein